VTDWKARCAHLAGAL